MIIFPKIHTMKSNYRKKVDPLSSLVVHVLTTLEVQLTESEENYFMNMSKTWKVYGQQVQNVDMSSFGPLVTQMKQQYFTVWEYHKKSQFQKLNAKISNAELAHKHVKLLI